jgi:Na+-transporting NADH:ubiquinone oxidoreductase subunit F
MILAINTTMILTSLIVFLLVILLLTVILLVAKRYLVPSGDVTITINEEKQIIAPAGSTLLGTLSAQQIFFLQPVAVVVPVHSVNAR